MQEERAIVINPEQLVGAARKAFNNAYAPYSGYSVGAAVLAEDGQMYTGVNIENAVYPLTLCAERVAIFSAIAAGNRRILALAVATSNGGSPCGACRQVMREFGPQSMPIFIADAQGNYRTRTLSELLPDSFSADELRGGQA